MSLKKYLSDKSAHATKEKKTKLMTENNIVFESWNLYKATVVMQANNFMKETEETCKADWQCNIWSKSQTDHKEVMFANLEPY